MRRLGRISAGIKERLYFQQVLGPGINNDSGELVKVMRPKWLPVTSPVQTELLTIVRNDLGTAARVGDI